MSLLDCVYNLWDDKDEPVPDICSAVSLHMAADRISDPALGSYEYQSVTLGLTMLAKTFNHDHWALTPESHDGNRSAKKPDLLVELVYISKGYRIYPAKRSDYRPDGPELTMGIQVIYEAKASETGDRFEQALAQVTDHQIPQRCGNEYTMFVVVQRGLRFGFFEYHKDKQQLDRLGIPHFRGCVPVTHDFNNSLGEFRNFFPVGYQLPGGVLHLYHDTRSLRGLSNVAAQAIRTEAEAMATPCVFNFHSHPREINHVLARMAFDRPRAV